MGSSLSRSKVLWTYRVLQRYSPLNTYIIGEYDKCIKNYIEVAQRYVSTSKPSRILFEHLEYVLDNIPTGTIKACIVKFLHFQSLIEYYAAKCSMFGN